MRPDSGAGTFTVPARPKLQFATVRCAAITEGIEMLLKLNWQVVSKNWPFASTQNALQVQLAQVHSFRNCTRAFLAVVAYSKSATMSGKGAKGLSGSGKGAKGTMGDKKGDKKKPVSRSARAGLQFPVGRIHRLLKVRQAAAH